MAKLKTYIVTYHMTAAATRKAAAIRKKDPEATTKAMGEWMAWSKKVGKNLVDFGSPIGKGVKLSSSGASPSRRNLTGYSLLKAANLTAAKKLMKNHPHLSWTPTGCEIEVHELTPM